MQAVMLYWRMAQHAGSAALACRSALVHEPSHGIMLHQGHMQRVLRMGLQRLCLLSRPFITLHRSSMKARFISQSRSTCLCIGCRKCQGVFTVSRVKYPAVLLA